MSGRLTDVWVYLAASPLLWLTLTLVCYQAAYFIYKRLNFQPLANPVAIAVAMLVTILTLAETNYQTYFDGAQFVHFLLGPATVALAVPLYLYFDRVRKMALPLFVALVVGSATAALSAMGIAWLAGASPETIISLAPKSTTMPIAMGITEKIGGLPSLTAAFVMLTGILGAVFGKSVLRLLKIHDDAIGGFAIGLTSHGIGTARAFQVSEMAGAFAGLAMGLNGLATAVLLPVLVHLLGY
jgi:predicted murein hydrolase (TIGR00659 family)